MAKTASIKIQPWMRESGTRAVMKVLAAEGAMPRFVGGAVRDALLGQNVRDVDVATPLHPDAVTKRLEAAGIKAVPTGAAHGTVTAVTAKRNFEITTLRRDVATDGRRAEVAFDAGWAEDAQRRDFTMNALSLDAAGQVFDYVGGIRDARAGRVRFVGDPAIRIQEDVLRLLRFYRFFAHYGKGAGDAAARRACRAAVHLLPKLSAERVAAELMKLLEAPNPLPALRMMRADGVLKALLPEARGLDRLRRLLVLEPAPSANRRLAALIGRDAAAVAERLKFSGPRREWLTQLLARPALDLAAGRAAQRRVLYHYGADIFRDRVLLAAAVTGDGKRLKPLLALARHWKPVRFPLRGRDLLTHGVPAGIDMGKHLRDLEDWWQARDFKPSRAQCLAELKRRRAAT